MHIHMQPDFPHECVDTQHVKFPCKPNSARHADSQRAKWFEDHFAALESPAKFLHLSCAGADRNALFGAAGFWLLQGQNTTQSDWAQPPVTQPFQCATTDITCVYGRACLRCYPDKSIMKSA